MVFRKYRFSSYPSFEPEHSQLSPGEVPRVGAALPEGQSSDALLEPEIGHISAVGRAEAEIGGV